MKEGAKVLIQTVASLEKGDITGTVQNNIPPEELKHAPKIFKETCRINWEMPVENIYNLIRGLSPYPTAFTVLQDKTLKIFKAEKETAQHSHVPGSVHTDHKTYLKFAAPGGYISVTDIQLEGKKRMGVVEFLRGFRF